MTIKESAEQQLRIGADARWIAAISSVIGEDLTRSYPAGTLDIEHAVCAYLASMICDREIVRYRCEIHRLKDAAREWRRIAIAMMVVSVLVLMVVLWVAGR